MYMNTYTYIYIYIHTYKVCVCVLYAVCRLISCSSLGKTCFRRPNYWNAQSVSTPNPQAGDCGPANPAQDDKAKCRIPDWERLTFCEEGGEVWDRERELANSMAALVSKQIAASRQQSFHVLPAPHRPWSWHRKRRKRRFCHFLEGKKAWALR